MTVQHGDGRRATAGELKGAALAHGIPAGEPAAIAVAIALAESGGEIQVRNLTSSDDSYGPWQINRRAHPQYSPATLRTLDGNAAAMADISGHGTSWGAWSTYGNGRYRANLARARAAAPASSSGALVPAPTAANMGAGTVEQVGLQDWIAHAFGLDGVGQTLIVGGTTLVLSTAAMALIVIGILRVFGHGDPQDLLSATGSVAAIAAL